MKTRSAVMLALSGSLAFVLAFAWSVPVEGGPPSWVQTNASGFGDAGNSGVLTLTPFGGQLYAGTSNESGSGAQLWRTSDGFDWTEVLTDGFGTAYNMGIDHLFPFNGQLYAGTWADEVNGGEVYRSPDGLTWTRVVSQGFGDPTNAEIFRFAAFGGRLYAGTFSYSDAHGGEIWRSASGDSGTWTRVVANGFNGDVNNAGIASFEVFNGYLYAGTLNFATGGEVWRSSSGYSGSWKQVNQDGFGDVGNYGVTALAAFDGYLYAGTGHAAGGGAQVWRCQTCNGSDWQKVVDNGFGNPDTRATPALEVLAGQLYLVVGNPATGLEVWRTPNGTSWEQVGYGGFGDRSNRSPYYDNSVAVFGNSLFVGTVNWAQGGQVWLYLHRLLYLPLLQALIGPSAALHAPRACAAHELGLCLPGNGLPVDEARQHALAVMDSFQRSAGSCRIGLL
ncbi:MAG: hypothetical protein QHJ81_04470 [Anaerolineae bacterium]|nr:hypothetical protein [Anaerolineae bacterium]